MMEQYTELLSSYTLFSGLTTAQISILLSMSHTTTYNPLDLIIQEGEAAQNISIITEGEVEVFKNEIGNQNQFLLANLNKGDIIGEMSLLDKSSRAATVRALTQTTTLDIPINALHALAGNDSPDSQLIYYKIVENIARESCARLRYMNQIIANLLHDEKIKKDADTSKMNLFMGCWRF